MNQTAEPSRHDLNEVLAAVADALPVAVIVFDKNLCVVATNEKVRQLLKLQSREELQGKSIRDVNPQITAERIDIYRQVLSTGQAQVIVDEVDHAIAGKRLWQIQAIRVGDCVATISEDVTDKDAYHQLALQTVQIRKLRQEIEELKSRLP